MSPDHNYKVTLKNNWTATFRCTGVMGMNSYGWTINLTGADGQSISYFNDSIVCSTSDKDRIDEDFMNSCLVLSDDGKFGCLKTKMGSEWILDFENCKLAPYKIYIEAQHVRKMHKTLSVRIIDQPAYKGAYQSIKLETEDRYIQVTFPFCSEEEIIKELAAYEAIRKPQIEEAYFNTREIENV